MKKKPFNIHKDGDQRLQAVADALANEGIPPARIIFALLEVTVPTAEKLRDPSAVAVALGVAADLLRTEATFAIKQANTTRALVAAYYMDKKKKASGHRRRKPARKRAK
jgi:hypothetical protein